MESYNILSSSKVKLYFSGGWFPGISFGSVMSVDLRACFTPFGRNKYPTERLTRKRTMMGSFMLTYYILI